MLGPPRLALVLALLVSCDAAPELHSEPHALHFSPTHRELPLRLVHKGDQPLPLSRIRLDHRDPDWSAFSLVDPTLPRQIEPNGEVSLRLRVDLDHFATHRGGHEYRSGGATLTFNADTTLHRIALHFADEAAPAGLRWLRLGLLAALAAGVFALRRRVPWTIALPAALALAIAPLASGLCWTLGIPLGPADLQQCGEGRGGTPLQMLPHADGLGLLLALLLFTALPGVDRISAAVLWSRLTLALAILAAVLTTGSLDPQVIVTAQTGLRWGLWVQPFAAAALALAALSEVAAARAHSPFAARAAAFGLAALLTTLHLGGADLPLTSAAPGLPHIAAVGLAVVAWLAKVMAVGWFLLRVESPRPAVYLVLALVLAQLMWNLTLGPHETP